MRKAEAGDPVVITRHGKAVVALVRADRLQQLERLSSAGPANVDKRVLPAVTELSYDVAAAPDPVSLTRHDPPLAWRLDVY